MVSTIGAKLLETPRFTPLRSTHRGQYLEMPKILLSSMPMSGLQALMQPTRPSIMQRLTQPGIILRRLRLWAKKKYENVVTVKAAQKVGIQDGTQTINMA